jgi:hypothetical protein
VAIIQQAATSGFGAALRVILGSATADLVLLAPALAFGRVIRALDRGGAVGRRRRRLAFLCLAATLVARDVLPRLG